jgi:hypothetical protein
MLQDILGRLTTFHTARPKGPGLPQVNTSQVGAQSGRRPFGLRQCCGWGVLAPLNSLLHPSPNGNAVSDICKPQFPTL